ncbi:MAG: hypothetical protein J6Q15_03580, partial [Clostridia bacterium]|nr:hypothetical protein [Clostridia bacterium]
DDTFLYYYQDDNGNLKQYALRGLYIAYSLAHSTNKLVNTFDYPVESLADIPMSVNYDLLDWCINYEQFVEVSPSNRVLEFYIEVSPMATINFEIKTNENDRFKESRTVYVSDVPVATATEGLELSVLNSYLGFVSEETLLNFIANDLYYSEAKLTIDYVDEKLADSELNVSVNSNVRYMIIGDATITIELLPKTYQFDAVIEYNGTEYSTTQYAEVTNASGINIFNEVNGIVIKNTIQNIDPTTGTYYLGDVIHINYNLNEGLSDDFDVTVYCNGSKLNYDNNVNAYVAEFEGTDIKIVICVEAKAEVVTLTTNFNNKIIADIYGQVNNGEMIRVEDVKNNYKQFELVNGDVLNIYIKANVGYKFSENYVHKETLVNVTPVLGEGTYEGYLTFTMFATGFNLSQVGWY